MKQSAKQFLIALGVTLNFAPALGCYIAFYGAYFNGYNCRIWINNYGEANVEFILLIPILFFSLVSIALCWIGILKYDRKEKGL